jgi:hypothetical protein
MATAAAPKTRKKAAPAATSAATGKISQVIGAVVDVSFEGELPAILSALETENNGTAWCWKWPSTWVRTPSAPSRWTRPTA